LDTEGTPKYAATPMRVVLKRAIEVDADVNNASFCCRNDLGGVCPAAEAGKSSSGE
jgi:hypothetical protein